MLSLYIPSPHAALYDRGEFNRLHLLCSFTDDFGLRQESIGSALPKFPSSVSDGGMVSRLHCFAARYGLSSCLPP